MSEVVGGPFGRHARPHRWWVPVRILLALFAVVFALSVVQHQPCLKTNWANNEARYGKACYSDIPYLYTGRGFAEGLWPYADNHGRYEVMEYPVGISYLAWVTAKITQIHPSAPTGRGAPPPGPGLAVVAARDDQGGQHLLPGDRDRAGGVRAAGDVVPGGGGSTTAVGCAAVRAVPGPADERADQLGPDVRRVRRRRPVGVGARPLRADRRDDRARHRRQALPALPARPDPRGGLATASARRGPRRRLRRGRGHLGGGEPARLAERPRPVARCSGSSTPSAVPTSGRCGWR